MTGCGFRRRQDLLAIAVAVLQLSCITNQPGVEAFTPSTALVGLSLLSPSGKTSSSSSSSTSKASNVVLGMFTGIVEEIGTVVNCETRNDMTLWDGSVGQGTELTVEADVVLDGAYLGCSICVSGVCLTATEITGNTFKAGLAPETLAKTYFGNLQGGTKVNLERASEIGGRNSGHFVQGHVDYTGTIIEKRPEGDSLWFTVNVDDPDLIKYIVPKGFIAIDGTSLTVVDVNPSASTFTFMLVEYTQKKIVQPFKQVGDKVNLEVDVLGKYSETALAALIPRIESLEAKVESLERQVAGNGNGNAPRGGSSGSTPSVSPPSSSSSTVNSFGTSPTTTTASAAKVSPMRPGSPDGPLNMDSHEARDNYRRGATIQTQNQMLGYEPPREPTSSNFQNRVARQVLGSKLKGHDEYISPTASQGNMFAAGSASSPPPPSSSSSSSTTSQQQRSSSAATDTSNNNEKPGISGEPPIFQRSRSYKFAST
eukprot:CAMPEP_0113473482 /NCGR_PEP_ID=MMETSP0014_2-20120614/18070_1 /TAXON_ID=2857 /ORGANISM="Nitzschia sp." /LENGTH=482 /DNA_ID=CAMNT_0000366257 /DNA_START=98 /DNA_END=1542 /DNA_ORIENTATION=+ /assembly_acc=CAM_ASM_000159